MTQWGAVTTIQTLPSLGKEPVPLEIDSLPSLTSQHERRSLSDGIRGLYQTCQLFDLSIHIGTSRFPAHRAVLAALSRTCCDLVHEAERRAHEAEQCSVGAGQQTAQDGSVQKQAEDGKVAPSNPSRPITERPKLFLEGVTSEEAVRAFLDIVYGLADDYTVSTDEANKDVLRLAKMLDLPFLENLAAQKVVKGITTSNVVARMATCKDFELQDAYAAIETELVNNKLALRAVSNNPEVVDHPRLLQSLLIRTASVHRPVTGKRPAEETATAPVAGRQRKA